MSNTLDTLVRELKKLAESALTPKSPFERVITTCKKFLALGELIPFEKIARELKASLYEIEESITKIRSLINEIRKHE